MNEKTILKVSVVCALAGIFALYIISDSIVIDETTINNIEGKGAGEDVKIKGIVKEVFNGNKATVAVITKPEEVTVVLYGNASLQKGDYVEVIGEIGEDSKEVIGNRVRVI